MWAIYAADSKNGTKFAGVVELVHLLVQYATPARGIRENMPPLVTHYAARELHYAARGPEARGRHNATRWLHNVARGWIMWHVGGIFSRSRG